MKRLMILSTLIVPAVMAVTPSLAIAQQPEVIQPESVATTFDSNPMPGDNLPVAQAHAAEQEFVWQSSILRRFDESSADSNRTNLYIPRTFSSGREWRGVGQIFSPAVIYPFYHDPRIYNENSQILLSNRYPDNVFASDEEYVDQFKDAKEYVIDSLQIWAYRRDQSIPEHEALIKVFATTADLRASSYMTGGFHAPRTALQERYSRTLPVSEIYETRDDETSTIFARREKFDPPLSFAAGESAVVMYINDEAPSLATPPTGAEQQIVWGTVEYRTGTVTRDANGTVISSTRGDSLAAYKTLGLVMYRGAVDKKDTIHSAWTNLLLDNRPAVFNMNMTVWGSVNLQSGVRYYFGGETGEEGLGEVTPNPVVADNGQLSFTLGKASQLTIDIFDTRGLLVARLVDGRYVPGRYSVALPTNELSSGLYLARMTVGSRFYTRNIVVSK